MGRRVCVSAVRPRRGVRAGVTTDLQMQEMQLPGLGYCGHGAPSHATVPSGLVFGRLPGRHPHRQASLRCNGNGNSVSGATKQRGDSCRSCDEPWFDLSGTASPAMEVDETYARPGIRSSPAVGGVEVGRRDDRGRCRRDPLVLSRTGKGQRKYEATPLKMEASFFGKTRLVFIENGRSTLWKSTTRQPMSITKSRDPAMSQAGPRLLHLSGLNQPVHERIGERSMSVDNLAGGQCTTLSTAEPDTPLVSTGRLGGTKPQATQRTAAQQTSST